MKKLNLPNQLTVLRLLLVPFILVFTLIPYSIWANLIALAIFIAASLTDMYDGKIARRDHLITDFGKFLDPLADKFMVIAAIFGIVCRAFREQNRWMFWIFMAMLIVTIFRELAVASIRLVASTSGGVVVAANMLGKIKTVTQMICIILALFEPVAHDILGRIFDGFQKNDLYGFYVFSYLAAAAAIVFTVWSGVVYLKSYWKFIDPEK